MGSHYGAVLVENGLPTDFIDSSRLRRCVVSIVDATLTRLISSQPAKMDEWEQLKRVTVDGIAVRGSVGLVESSSTQVETSSTQVQGGSTAGVRAA